MQLFGRTEAGHHIEPATKRALLADDEPAFTILVERLLREAGYDVVRADTADEAVDSAKTFRPHVALLDVNMPGDGISACQAIVSESSRATAVIMITGSDSEQTLGRAMAAGAADFINKPIDWDALVPLVESHVSHLEETHDVG